MDELVVKPMPLILKEKIFENIRLYDGKPSVTSVLKILKDDDAFERFKAQDYEGRERMLKAKGEVGTKLHEIIAKTYLDKKFYSCPTVHGPAWMKFYTKEGWKREPVVIEEFVSDDRIGGTLDCTMVLDGEEYIVDRKTYGTKTYDSLIFKYKMQLGKYAQLYNKQMGKSINKGKIVMFGSKNEKRKVLEIDNLEYRGNLFDAVQDQFFIYYNERNEIQSPASGV